MIFPEHLEAFSLYRQTTSTSGWEDTIWQFITTVSGRAEPINPQEQILQNQAFPNIAETFFCDIVYKGIVRAGDGLMDIYGEQRKVIGHPEVWGWEIQHLACRLEHVQWTVVS